MLEGVEVWEGIGGQWMRLFRYGDGQGYGWMNKIYNYYGVVANRRLRGRDDPSLTSIRSCQSIWTQHSASCDCRDSHNSFCHEHRRARIDGITHWGGRGGYRDNSRATRHQLLSPSHSHSPTHTTHTHHTIILHHHHS